MRHYSSYEIIEGNPAKGLVLLADHAMNHIPPEYDRLGLPDSAFARHIAYDIGIDPLVRQLSAALDAPAVLGCFSRLLIDPNRGEDDPTLVMKISDGAIIPGNHPMSEEERQGRLDRFHRPYHGAVAQTIAEAAAASGKAPLVISLHSFTPAWKGIGRPWHAAVLWDNDPRAVLPLIERLERDGDIVVGNNEPYDGALRGDTMYRHCMAPGIAHALIEIRQDLIADEEGVAAWAGRLTPILAEVNAMPAVHAYQRHPSRTGAYDGDEEERLP